VAGAKKAGHARKEIKNLIASDPARGNWRRLIIPHRIESRKSAIMAQGFYIQVHNQLLNTKHYLAMRESVWLFMWFLDRVTMIDEKGIGWVLGKRPIRYEDVEINIDVSARNYKRWVVRLRTGGYILTIRAPYGLIIGICKAKKKFKKDVDKSVNKSVDKKKGSAKNGPSHVTEAAHLYTKNGPSKYIGINQSVDNTGNTVAKNLKNGKKPSYQGQPMWISEDGWTLKVKGDDGKWHDFGRPASEIVWT
jgi:hypothetical protein